MPHDPEVQELFNLNDCDTFPEPTVDLPTIDQLDYWLFDGVAEATDGCEIEPDGVCEHAT